MSALTVALGCLFAYLVLAPPPTYDWQPVPAAVQSSQLPTEE
ncbi:hypothetical protein ACWCRC_32870 [Streptomyces sp. NPDC001940]